MARLTDRQIDCLLYGETEVEVDNCRITAWMDFGSAEKHIDIFRIGSERCHSFIANGMDRDQLRQRIESRI